jgi:hypothetical protein
MSFCIDVVCESAGDGKSGRFAMDDLSLNLVKIDKDLDFAVLTTSKSYAHVQLFRGDPQTLRGKGLVLCTYQIGLQQYLQEFDLQLIAMSVSHLLLVTLSSYQLYRLPFDAGVI